MKLKWCKKTKYTLISLVCVVVLVSVLIATLCTAEETIDINNKEYYRVVKTEADAKAFVNQFYEAGELYGVNQKVVPQEFNDIYTIYNELQKKQGLDLEKYKGEESTIYTYKLKDKVIEDNDSYMCVMVCDERVIGGHITTFVKDSPMYTFYGDEL